MFSAKGLFKHIVCPDGAACRMPNCMFGHDFPGTSSTAELDRFSRASQPAPAEVGPDQKRRRLEDGTSASAPRQTSSDPEKKAFTGGLVSSKPAVPSGKSASVKPQSSRAKGNSATHLKSVGRPVSPPPTAAAAGQKAQPGSAASKVALAPSKKPVEPKKETLNPRRVPKEPEKWGTRTMLLEKLHQMMVPLNEQAGDSSDPELKALHLDDNALIKAALDEEEELAKVYGKVYSNMIKLRIMAYKKMNIEKWKQHRIALTAGAAPKKPEPKTKLVETGLTPEQETMFLQRLVAKQVGLDKYGYVTAVPTDADIEQARQGVAMSANYEVCERCSTRFQVFPERRVEDGALTTGSHCTFHWGKLSRPRYKKTEAITGRAEMHYTCCHESPDSGGCSTLDSHVFKISEAKRLALVLPFISTPPNPNAIKGRAVCFDCEMGYTVHGLELIRLTATSWPDGEALIDVLVRPVGTVLDLNTRFSGVTAEQFFNAQPYDPADPASANPRAGAADGKKEPELRIVSSPAEARALLLSFIAPETPVLGHALENDLNSIRLVHPTIVDTVLLFPIKAGLPARPSLKGLVQGNFGKEIQTGGAAGHDSFEDSWWTGELVRAKVEREWRQMRNAGWTVREDGFYPPRPKGGQAEGPAALLPISPMSMGKSKKRKGSASTSE